MLIDTPKQQSGFWAHNLDTSIVGAITADVGWLSVYKTMYPFIGPPSDHTGKADKKGGDGE